MELTIFLCGDVMLGRGIDQIMKYKNDPTLYESSVSNAKYYVPKEMAIYTEPNKFVSYDYFWGDLLLEPLFIKSNLKIINLETSITSNNEHENKAVLYKMNPKNISIFDAIGRDSLYLNMSNNHVLDWKLQGLKETINTLTDARIKFGGIGNNILEASKPTIIQINNNRILIFSYGDIDSGIPQHWKATYEIPGVNLINSRDPIKKKTKNTVAQHINKYYQKGDFVVVSIHWGSNWGFEVESYHEQFAHYLIDNANVDIIHGHSSHHVRPIEIYHNKLILYGCGDFITDYEIIKDPKHEYFISDISVAYFTQYKYENQEKKLSSLILVPYTIHNMKLIKVSTDKINTFTNKLNKICQKYNTHFEIKGEYLICNLADI